MYKVELADGTVIDNLELNGNNFVPQEPIDRDIFEDNLSKVIITDTDSEGNVEEYEDMKVIFAKIGETETFVLIEKTKEEKEKEILQQRIDDLELYILLQEGLI